MTHWISSAAAVLAGVTAATAQVAEYDLSALEPGDLDGQDNWTTQPNRTDHDLHVAPDGGPDQGPILRFDQNGPGVGVTAWRTANPDFNHPRFDGTERTAVLEATVTPLHWGLFLGFATPDAPSVRLLVNGRAARVEVLGPDDQRRGVDLTEDLLGWTRYRLLMDFTADDGHGRASLWARPDGADAFTCLLEDIDLGLDPTRQRPAGTPAAWDRIHLHMEGAVGQLAALAVGTQPSSDPTRGWVDDRHDMSWLSLAAAWDLADHDQDLDVLGSLPGTYRLERSTGRILETTDSSRVLAVVHVHDDRYQLEHASGTTLLRVGPNFTARALEGSLPLPGGRTLFVTRRGNNTLWIQESPPTAPQLVLHP